MKVRWWPPCLLIKKCHVSGGLHSYMREPVHPGRP